MLDYIVIFAFQVAVFAFVWVVLLTERRHLLYGFRKWLDEVLNKPCEGYEHPIYKILIGCERCVAGQVALWSYMFGHVHRAGYTFVFEDDYSFTTHVSVVIFSILFTAVLTKLYRRI